MNNQPQRPNTNNIVDQAVSAQQPKVAVATTKRQVVVEEPTTVTTTQKKPVVIQDISDDPVANSRLPSNETIDNAMETLKSELLTAKQNTPGLNAKGERIVDSAAQVVDSAQAFIQEKNEGDRLQNLILESRQAASDMKDHAKDTGTTHAGIIKDIDHDRLREMAEKALETARLAGTELVSSNSFRMVLRDFVQLLYDAMKGIVVSEEEYKKHQAEKSASSTDVDDDEVSKKKTKKKKTKKSTSTSVSKNTTDSGVHMDERTTVHTQETHEETRAGKDLNKDLNKDLKKDSTVKSEDGDLQNAAETIETKLNRQLSDLGLAPRVRLSKEDLDDLLERFLHILRNISKRESTRKVFTDILDLLRLFGEEVGLREDEDGNAPMKEHAVFTAGEIKDNEHLQNSLILAKELFEQFTGNNTLDPILDHLRAIARVVREDTQVRDFFEELSTYFRECIDEPSKIDSEEFMRHGRRLIKKFRKFRSQKVYEHIEGIAYQAGLLIDAIRNDPATLRLKDDMKNLIRELAFDADGNFAIKAEVIDQLKLVILNSVVERMKIPLPPLHTKDDKLELHVTNMVVAAKDVVPARIVVEDIGKLAIDLGNASSPALEKAKNDIKITIEKINVHMTNVQVEFQRFSFPKIADNGTAKLDIGGKGIDLEINIRTFPGSNQLFRVDKINCDVHSLKLHLDDTRHDALYNTVLKLVKKKIKRNIAKSIEDMLRNQLENLNSIASKAIVHAKVAAGTVKDKAIEAKNKMPYIGKNNSTDQDVIAIEGQQVPADEVVLKQRKLEATTVQSPDNVVVEKRTRMTTV